MRQEMLERHMNSRGFLKQDVRRSAAAEYREAELGRRWSPVNRRLVRPEGCSMRRTAVAFRLRFVMRQRGDDGGTNVLPSGRSDSHRGCQRCVVLVLFKREVARLDLLQPLRLVLAGLRIVRDAV